MPQTLAAALQRSWLRWPERPALSFQGRRISYGELAGAVRSYRGWGFAGGDRVVCAVSNRPEHVIAMLGAWSSGAVHVGVDHQSTGVELSAAVDLVGASTLVYEPDRNAPDPDEVVRVVRHRHPALRVIGVGAGAELDGCLPWSAVRAAPGRSEEPRPDDAAIVFITSGTTGRPKATVGFHGNLAERWQRLAGWLQFSPDDVHLAQLPLSHGFGLMMAVSALLSGGRLALLDRFTAHDALGMVTKERVTVFNGAPAHFSLLLAALSDDDVSSLRLSVGTAAAFPPSLVRSIWRLLDVRFMYMYGSSEGVGVATTDPDDILLGSVGCPARGSVRVVGPDREPLPTGEVGEVAFSRRAFPVRYWDDSGTSPPTLHDAVPLGSADSWYYSGDLGRLDNQGRLYILGRTANVIDRGGLKVDPVEVENALLECPGVADAAVIGRPNPVLGATVCACITPSGGAPPTLPRLQADLRRTLAPHKIPEELCIMETIPRTPIGKVDMPQLRCAIAATETSRVRWR